MAEENRYRRWRREEPERRPPQGWGEDHPQGERRVAERREDWRRNADDDMGMNWTRRGLHQPDDTSLGEGPHRGRGPRGYVRSDERIREDVNDRLTEDSWLDASNIEVRVAAGEVTLAGTVAERGDKRRAEDLAEQVSGVQHVQNNLRLHGRETPRVPAAAPAPGQAPTSPAPPPGLTAEQRRRI